MSPFLHHLRAIVLVLIAGLATLWAVPASAAEGPATGLPLPRFASTRSQPINVRVGPGTRYDVAWVYVKSGTPVEIVQEFDTWRKIRDVDGSEGWIHQNLLSGKRAGVIAPSGGDERVVLLADRAADSGVRAYLGPGYRVDISECDGQWCEVSATYAPEPGHNSNVSGYLPQNELWGVYADEEFD